jgi:hypothetical protein
LKNSIIKKEFLPFLLIFSSLIFLTIIADFLLHQKKIIWVGRYWGYIGTILIVLSFTYSLRKRKIIKIGRLKYYLMSHEYFGWLGALMILVHGGIHFNGLLAWLAVGAMLVTIASGLTGRVLLKRSRERLKSRRRELLQSGLETAEVDDQLFWDATAVDIMNKWRSVHIPITSVFVLLALIHIISIFIFW